MSLRRWRGASAPARIAAASWATSTCSWSATAARTGSPTTSARSTTSSNGPRPAAGGSERLLGGRRLGLEPELGGVRRHRVDDELYVLAFVDAQLLDPLSYLPAVDLRGERRLLEFLPHRLRLHPLEAGGPHASARGDESRELVDRIERLREAGFTRDAEVLGVARDGVEHLGRISARLELLERVSRMTGVGVGIALVVEVVDEARDGPLLLVL